MEKVVKTLTLSLSAVLIITLLAAHSKAKVDTLIASSDGKIDKLDAYSDKNIVYAHTMGVVADIFGVNGCVIHYLDAKGKVQKEFIYGKGLKPVMNKLKNPFLKQTDPSYYANVNYGCYFTEKKQVAVRISVPGLLVDLPVSDRRGYHVKDVFKPCFDTE